jgi:hypothetical protein
MELVRVSAGFMRAHVELAAKLPRDVAPTVRDLVMRMSKELGAMG